MATSVHPRSGLVVGAGPSGLVTLRNLIELGNFDRVELVERRDDVGGVWYLDEHEESKAASSRPQWPSPAYPGLIGNVLPEFLSFSHSPFPEPPGAPHQPYPTLNETEDYLRSFAEPYLKKGNIRLNTEVVRVEELAEGKGWNVTVRDWNQSGEARSEAWDAVAICTGWYDDPLYPETEGLDVVQNKGLVRHAKWYRGPQGYEGKRILVIGNGNSSNDIAAHMAPLAQNPVYRSVRRPAFPHFVSLPDPRIKDVAPIKRYILQSDDKVAVELQDGTKIEDIDVVFIGSGYKPNPSFVYVRSPGSTATEAPLTRLMSQIAVQSPQSRRIPSLHKHIMYAYNPTLAFVGSLLCFTPFTISDVSSTWLTLAWTNEIAYPSTPEERLKFEKERIQTLEVRRQAEAQRIGHEASSLLIYATLGVDEEDYAADLKSEVVGARPELKDVLPEWNEKRRVHRQSMYALKYKSLEWAKEQREKLGRGVGNGIANGAAA